MRIAGSIIGIALAAALGACAHHNVQSAGAQAPQEGAAASCALAQLKGVHASVADIHDGVAITFTGPESGLDQLRDNVKAMADANDKQGDAFAVCPCAQPTALGSAEPMPGEAAATTIPRAESKVEETSTGAILKLTTKDNSQIAALRAMARKNVHAFKKACLGKGAIENKGLEPEPANR